MQDAELGPVLLAHGARQSQGQLGARAASNRHEHAPDGRRVRPDQGDIAGRVGEQVLDGVDPQPVAPLAIAGFEHQQVGVGFQRGLPDTLRGHVGDPHLAAELPGTALRVARDAREQGAVGARHLHAFAERALRRHLDDAEQGAARVFRVEKRRDGLE